MLRKRLRQLVRNFDSRTIETLSPRCHTIRPLAANNPPHPVCLTVLSEGSAP